MQASPSRCPIFPTTSTSHFSPLHYNTPICRLISLPFLAVIRYSLALQLCSVQSAAHHDKCPASGPYRRPAAPPGSSADIPCTVPPRDASTRTL